MNEQLTLLISLQNADIKIKELEDIIKKLPKELAERRNIYQTNLNEYTKLKQELEDKEKQRRFQERQLQVILDELEKFQKKIYEVKTQKEMEALDAQIKQKRQERAQTEDQILNLMIIIEELETKLKTAKEAMDEQENFYKQKEIEYQRKLADSQQELQISKKERENVIQGIDKGLLEVYEKLRKQKNNLAVVEVKNGNCLGCYTSVPTQVINQLKLGEDIIRCDRCSRILYLANNST
jgi:predicted  nucleic acid-binding Zn-ribbon protein